MGRKIGTETAAAGRVAGIAHVVAIAIFLARVVRVRAVIVGIARPVAVVVADICDGRATNYPAVVRHVVDQRTAAVDAEFGHEISRTAQPSRNTVVAFQKGVRDYGDRRPRRIVFVARAVVVIRVDADRIGAPPSTHAAGGGRIKRSPVHRDLA